MGNKPTVPPSPDSVAVPADDHPLPVLKPSDVFISTLESVARRVANKPKPEPVGISAEEACRALDPIINEKTNKLHIGLVLSMNKRKRYKALAKEAFMAGQMTMARNFEGIVRRLDTHMNAVSAALLLYESNQAQLDSQKLTLDSINIFKQMVETIQKQMKEIGPVESIEKLSNEFDELLETGNRLQQMMSEVGNANTSVADMVTIEDLEREYGQPEAPETPAVAIPKNPTTKRQLEPAT